jgi:hypothetical protein
MSTEWDGRGVWPTVESRQHDPDSKGKRQGVIQSGENRVLLLFSALPFSPRKTKGFAATGERQCDPLKLKERI